jgi:hypothetical protein
MQNVYNLDRTESPLSPHLHRCGHFFAMGGPVMPHRPFRTPLRGTITIRVDDGLLEKIDELAVTLNRSRADMLRQLIMQARMTGLPDVAVDLPVEATIA